MMPGRRGRARRGGRATAGLFAIALTALAALVPRAHGKELAAHCGALERMLQEADMAIQLARAERDRGSALAAQQVLMTTLADLRDKAGKDGCGAAERVLEVTLARARKARTATQATLVLDLGVSSLRSLALLGIIAGTDLGAKSTKMSESVFFGEGCPELYSLTQRLHGDAAGREKRARAVLTTLSAQSAACPALTQELTVALASGGSEAVRIAIDNVLLDARPESRSDVGWGHRCPELPIVADRLRAAIAIGAPLFNQGDHAGCRDGYERAAHTLVQTYAHDERCPRVRIELEHGRRAAAASASATDAAWALRRSFDRLLGLDDEPVDDEPAPGAAPDLRVQQHAGSTLDRVAQSR